MDSMNFFSHINPDGKGPLERLQGSNIALSPLRTLPSEQQLAGRLKTIGYAVRGTAGTRLTAVSLDTVWGE